MMNRFKSYIDKEINKEETDFDKFMSKNRDKLQSNGTAKNYTAYALTIIIFAFLFYSEPGQFSNIINVHNNNESIINKTIPGFIKNIKSKLEIYLAEKDGLK